MDIWPGRSVQPWRAEDSLKSQGKRIFKSKILKQLRAANRETSLLVPKQTSTSISFSISPILLIDRMEKNTQRRASPLSSGHGTPTDMKTLELLLRRTWEAWHRMKGNPPFRNNTGSSKVAFQGLLNGFLPMTLTPAHTQPFHPLLCWGFFCLLVTSLSELQSNVDPFTFVSQFISTSPRLFFLLLLLTLLLFFSSSVSFFTRAVEQSICRKAPQHHVSLWNMWYRLWPVHVFLILF